LALEDEVKAAGALRKAVEQYKERVLEMERERFKAMEGMQVRGWVSVEGRDWRWESGWTI
jgi:hypothetical protein